MQIIQTIEMNQQVRRSNYSFEMHGNDLKVFPVPNQPGSIWFQYIFNSDRSSGVIKCAEDKINNVGNANFKNPNYNLINSIGRQWIFEMTLAISKEMLAHAL